ncbi:MAG: RNase adaptor protein RapZ, partial [Burkholderiales bacterium]|nr:RNase adaptor protein RapZ [Burkholderiales bacterium]
MRIVIITGMSGSGKSVALNVLEDGCYYCVDNMPPALLPELVQTLSRERVNKLAVAMDVRSSESLASLPQDIEHLRT